MSNFNNADAAVLIHALNLTELYYMDSNRSVKGMHKPSPETVKHRLAEIGHVIRKLEAAKFYDAEPENFNLTDSSKEADPRD